METLAVVAYRQPVLRVEIEAIRGVQSGELLRQLIERDLVRIVGRSQELGRPFLYGTTKQFLQVFGLRHIDELQNPKNPFNQFPVAEEEKNVKTLTKQIIPNSRRAAQVEPVYDDLPEATRAFAKFEDDDDGEDEDEDLEEDEEELDEEEDDEDLDDEPWEEVDDEDEDLEDEDEDEDWDEEDEDWEEEDWDEDEDEDEDDWSEEEEDDDEKE
jgi:segregation and condensation protein B